MVSLTALVSYRKQSSLEAEDAAARERFNARKQRFTAPLASACANVESFFGSAKGFFSKPALAPEETPAAPVVAEASIPEMVMDPLDAEVDRILNGVDFNAELSSLLAPQRRTSPRGE